MNFIQMKKEEDNLTKVCFSKKQFVSLRYETTNA